MAAMAASVSAYAVSSTARASGINVRTSASSSIPVIPGMR